MNRRPPIPPNKKHKDKKNDYKRKPKHQSKFSEFIRNATPEEKEKVYNEVMQKASEAQKKVIDN